MDTMVLFDWRDGHLTDAQRAEVPSFAYVLPVDDRTLFIEETVLVCDDKFPVDRLRQRLRQRVAAAGLRLRPGGASVKFVEQYSFPMGGPLPELGQRVVGVGATARMVHPASGYMVGYALNAIPSVVAELVAGLGRLRPLLLNSGSDNSSSSSSSSSGGGGGGGSHSSGSGSSSDNGNGNDDNG